MRLWERMKGQRGTAALLALLLVAVLACTALEESYPFAGGECGDEYAPHAQFQPVQRDREDP